MNYGGTNSSNNSNKNIPIYQLPGRSSSGIGAALILSSAGGIVSIAMPSTSIISSSIVSKSSKGSAGDS